jgi:hypothetical protein
MTDDQLERMKEALRKAFAPGPTDKLIGDAWKEYQRLSNPPHWCVAYKIKSVHYNEGEQ